MQNSCKVMAKDLVRTRRYISKFYGMKTQLQAVSLRIQTLRSNQQMAEAMKGATKVRFSPSSSIPLPPRSISLAALSPSSFPPFSPPCRPSPTSASRHERAR